MEITRRAVPEALGRPPAGASADAERLAGALDAKPSVAFA